MAKITHNNAYDTIDEMFTDAKNRGIMHLHTNVDETPERKLKIAGKDLLNFGTCGYLGLELDQRLKDGAIEMLQKYGTQFSVSRVYLTSGIHDELEGYLSKMFDDSPVITYSSTTIAHISVVPIVVSHNDAVVLDQQVHMSIQNAVQLLRQKGTVVEKIRHSNMEMLEDKIKELSQKYEKVWYMMDGVYSMFGDLAPMHDLVVLMEKYKKLHIYVDDAHGMGWYGKNGTGYVFNKAPKHPKIILVSTLAKGFGVMGGLVVFPDKETHRKVKVWGGPLSYSHPLSPALIGSSIAAAKILLSDEAKVIQHELRERMDYCNDLLAKTDLTVMSNPLTPIYFVGMGQLKVGYNMIKRLMNDGFFVNTALFPVVALHQTGLRFTITRHIQKEDIKKLVNAIAYHYPKILEEEGITMNEVRRAFGKEEIKTADTSVSQKKSLPSLSGKFTIEESKSIINLNQAEWDRMLGPNGSFDYRGMKTLEEVFKNNPKPEENCEFYYLIIRDENRVPVVATFLTSTIIKDDMLSLESISQQIEEQRKTNPYYLTSHALMMGCMLTEGNHYYVNKKYPQWQEAFTLLLNKISEIQESIRAETLLLRDFDKGDVELAEIFAKEGFAKIDLPCTNIVENMTWNSREELLNFVSANNRKHIRREVFRHEDKFEVEYKNTLTEEETKWFYHLYTNVHERNKGFNMFLYPKDVLKKISKNPSWEFVVLKLKPEYDTRKERKAVAAVWCYISDAHYSPMIIGLDYDYTEEYKVYKQALYQLLKRARMLNLSKVRLGLSADMEKHKFGAKQYPRVAYMQAKDIFNMEVIESMSAINQVVKI